MKVQFTLHSKDLISRNLKPAVYDKSISVFKVIGVDISKYFVVLRLHIMSSTCSLKFHLIPFDRERIIFAGPLAPLLINCSTPFYLVCSIPTRWIVKGYDHAAHR